MRKGRRGRHLVQRFPKAFCLLGCLFQLGVEKGEKLLDLPFTVDSELFAEDLEAMPPEWMARLQALLGLSVPWVAEDMKGGPEV